MKHEWRYEAWIGGFEISFGTESGVLGTLNIDSLGRLEGWMNGVLDYVDGVWLSVIHKYPSRCTSLPYARCSGLGC